MSKSKTLPLIAAILLCAAAACPAEEGSGFLEGTASAAVSHTTQEDQLAKVGEYVNAESIDRILPVVDLDLFGGQGSTLFDIMMLYRDLDTHAFEVGFSSGSAVDVELGYTAFVHNLDHDLLQNLQAREQVWNGTAYAPGGKQVYHTDHDPLGRYAIEYSKFSGRAETELPLGAGHVKTYLGYSDQKRQGWKQALTIDHCAVCHVTSDRREVDQETEAWYAGFEGDLRKLALKVEFNSSEFYDNTATPNHLYKDAVHPANGGSGGEFGSRLSFDDETLPYSRTAQSQKTGLNAQLKLALSPEHTLRGAITSTNRKNYYTGVESDLDAYVAAWAARPGDAWRLNARFMAYEAKVDDYAVDLDPFRNVAALDFDWNRISAANRQVMQADLAASYRLDKASTLKFDLRHKVIDRDAMAQSQTNYLFDDTGAIEEARVSEPYANETTIDRLRVSYNRRLGLKGNARLVGSFTKVDRAFMNPTAMCEESLVGTNSAHADSAASGLAWGRLYYFQRERYGNGTSEASQALRLNGQLSYQVGPRLSLSAFLNLASEKNDELNNYEFERTVLSPGVNLWVAPHDRVMWTLGYAFNTVESNAALCPPIFDG